MNVLVIGGSGLFGRKLCLQLAQDKDISSVVSMDVVPPADWIMKSLTQYKNKFRFVRGDVSRLEDILDTIKTHSIDRMVNLAFILPGVVEANPRLGVLVNELGMCNAFEAARLMGISRVIYASSEGVYGPQKEYGDRDVTEDDQMHPQNAYAIAKQMSEFLAASYAELYGINFTALRPPIVYGHGGINPTIIRWFSEIVSLPAAGKTFSIKLDGTDPHSLASPDDIARFVRMLIKVDSSPHPAYNIGGPPTTLRDVAEVVREYIPDAVIEFGKETRPPENGGSGIPWRLSMERARQDFGFSCMPLEEAILIHINDARMDAGLEPIKKKA
jgi:nucleoside-diphosphate-sugar epimerase